MRLATIGAVLLAAAGSACGSSSVTSVSPTPVRCEMSVTTGADPLPAGGGSATIALATAPECAWSAATQQAWITSLTPASGQGAASIVVEATANEGPPRSATITIADHRVTVLQASGCTYVVEPLALAAPSQGFDATLAVTTHDACAWSAMSQVPWVTVIDGASGTGSGIVRVTVDPNMSPPRQGTVSVAGRTVAIDQASGCAYTVAPDSLSVGAAQSEAAVSVNAGAGCSWNAASQSPWITLVSPPEGIGPGTVTFQAAGNTGPPRTGSLSVEGRVVTVQQAGGCTYAINPPALAFGFLGGTATVAITTAADCVWQAVPGVPWIQVADGQGSGSGRFTIGVGPSFLSRIGTVTIGDQTLTVRQN